MNKYLTLTVFILFTCSLVSFSQESDSVVNLAKVNLYNPGFSYEQKLGRHNTLVTNAYINIIPSFVIGDNVGFSAKVYFDPTFNLQFRHYYNGAKRMLANKSVKRNNMNYFGVLAEATNSSNEASSYFDIQERRLIYKLGGVWGLQRNISKRLSIDFNLGACMYYTTGTIVDFNTGERQHKEIARLSSLGHIHLGFWLGDKW